jgi:hypothetical protein
MRKKPRRFPIPQSVRPQRLKPGPLWPARAARLEVVPFPVGASRFDGRGLACGFGRPAGTRGLCRVIPALKRRAIFGARLWRLSCGLLAATGWEDLGAFSGG